MYVLDFDYIFLTLKWSEKLHKKYKETKLNVTLEQYAMLQKKFRILFYTLHQTFPDDATNTDKLFYYIRAFLILPLNCCYINSTGLKPYYNNHTTELDNDSWNKDTEQSFIDITKDIVHTVSMLFHHEYFNEYIAPRIHGHPHLERVISENSEMFSSFLNETTLM